MSASRKKFKTNDDLDNGHSKRENVEHTEYEVSEGEYDEIFLEVPFKDKTIPARIDCMSCTTKSLQNKVWVVLTHGAGGDMNTPQLAAVTASLQKSGFIVFRFTCKSPNLKYRIDVFAQMLKFICNSYVPKEIIVGGRSMGARAAVMLSDNPCISEAEKILGIICLSYPLHKVNCTKELRSGPLKECCKPLFLLSGTQDKMCQKELLIDVLIGRKTTYQVHWLTGYDHSAKSNNEFKEHEYVIALKTLVDWCKDISSI